MDDWRIPVDEKTKLAWAAVAHGARLHQHLLRNTGDPTPTSNFAQVNALYPHEKASDWHRSYLTAALEHLILWADMVAPLTFHPDHRVTHTFRPAYTLARAAIDASSQAVWLSAGPTARECARRHLSLIRWDYEEHRKGLSEPSRKQMVKDMDQRLLERAAGQFTPEELRPPTHFGVLREVAKTVNLDPDDLERVWRAASGSAHGRVWPSLALQHVVPLAEYEPGQFRTIRVPDPEGMTEVLTMAYDLTAYAVVRHAQYCQADVPVLIENARLWLVSVTPFREDADPEILARLRRREHS